MHPPGTIALPVMVARYHQFTYSLACLEQPPGTKLAMVEGCSIVVASNAIVRDMMEGEWLWLLADDHAFDPDILTRLLDRDVDVVVPVCWRRQAPFKLVLFREESERGGRPHYEPYHPADLPIDGSLMEVHAAGTAGMLIRKHVLDAIGDPWFVNSHNDVQNEDVEFCRQIREAGFTIWCDTSAWLGHVGNCIVWPTLEKGQWGMRLDYGNNCDMRTMFHPREPVAA